MLAGDVPRFGGGIHNDPRALNDLARRVGMLEAMRGVPPLRVDSGPAGYLLSMGETTGFAYRQVHAELPRFIPDTTTDKAALFSFSSEATGYYLITGRLYTRPVVSFGFTQFVNYKARFDDDTAGGIFSPPSGTNVVVYAATDGLESAQIVRTGEQTVESYPVRTDWFSFVVNVLSTGGTLYSKLTNHGSLQSIYAWVHAELFRLPV